MADRDSEVSPYPAPVEAQVLAWLKVDWEERKEDNVCPDGADCPSPLCRSRRAAIGIPIPTVPPPVSL